MWICNSSRVIYSAASRFRINSITRSRPSEGERRGFKVAVVLIAKFATEVVS